MSNKNTWRMVATGAIVVSIVTLFLPIITYENEEGVRQSYNIFGLMNKEFAEFVFMYYTGDLFYGMPYSTIVAYATALCVLGVVAIVCALVGINSMSKQYESEKPFHLALFGLVGTAIPSLVLLAVYIVSIDQLPGIMSLGAYLLVTPVAMVCAILAVTARHRLTREEIALQREASAYIRPAGDLPAVSPYGGRYGGGYRG